MKQRATKLTKLCRVTTKDYAERRNIFAHGDIGGGRKPMIAIDAGEYPFFLVGELKRRGLVKLNGSDVFNFSRSTDHRRQPYPIHKPHHSFRTSLLNCFP